MTDGERDLVPFSLELDRVMKHRGWVQADLVKATKISKGTVGNMLAGATGSQPAEEIKRPHKSTVLRLADGLKEPRSKWLRLAGWPVTDDEVKAEEQVLRERIAHGADRLEPDERRMLARWIEDILIARGYIEPPATTAGRLDLVDTHGEMSQDGVRVDEGQAVDGVPRVDPAAR